MDDNAADGTYVLIGGRNPIPPHTLITASDATAKISDAEILAAVEFVALEDARVPQGIAVHVRDTVRALKIHGPLNYKIALWPDGTIVSLYFSSAWSTPRDVQIIRAYRVARRALLAVRLHTVSSAGTS